MAEPAPFRSQRRMAVQSVRCSFCGAAPGEPCTTDFMAREVPPHKARIAEAQRKGKIDA